jgi:hypothetical protein
MHDCRRKVLTAWQERKQDEINHPFLDEKTTIGFLPHLQARLLARHLRADLDCLPGISGAMKRSEIRDQRSEIGDRGSGIGELDVMKKHRISLLYLLSAADGTPARKRKWLPSCSRSNRKPCTRRISSVSAGLCDAKVQVALAFAARPYHSLRECANPENALI